MPEQHEEQMVAMSGGCWMGRLATFTCVGSNRFGQSEAPYFHIDTESFLERAKADGKMCLTDALLLERVYEATYAVKGSGICCGRGQSARQCVEWLVKQRSSDTIFLVLLLDPNGVRLESKPVGKYWFDLPVMLEDSHTR